MRRKRLTAGMLRCSLIGMIGLSLLAASEALGKVDLNVTRIGFPTVEGDDVVRTGQWTPVLVDLTLIDEPLFDGRIRIAQFDADGDEAYDSVEVHLSVETGGTQRVTLYVLPNFTAGQGKFSVELQNMAGEAVQVLSQGELTRRARPARPPIVLPDDDLLILSVANGTIGMLGDLVDPQKPENYRRNFRVSHVSTADLPEHWIGLESVDYIRWENANPSDLSERQLQALIEWTNQGGTLLIMASPTDGSFASRKALDAVLPATIGELLTATTLEELFERMLRATRDDPPHTGYEPPVALVRCTARAGSTVLARDDLQRSDLITRRQVGHGTLIFAGITERNLFLGGGSATEFYRSLFHLCPIETKEEQHTRDVSMFSWVVSAVSFAVAGGAYLGIAALFSLGYVALATLGSWTFLKSRGWRHHNWTAFALVAVAASAVSVLGVNSIRGFGERLHQIVIVDAEVGQAYGRAIAFFGLKTGSDRVVSVWLPSDYMGAAEPDATNCFLRPIPVGAGLDETAGGYADPQEYRLLPSSAAIENVRIRGTLKQFEGRWEGRLGGKVSGQFTVRKQPGTRYDDWRFTDDSFLVNELGVELRDCYLLHSLFDLHAPLSRDPGERFQNDHPRDIQTYAFSLGTIGADAKVFLAEACYKPIPGQTEFRPLIDGLLKEAQKAWGRTFRGALESVGQDGGAEVRFTFGHQQNALLLLSTLGDFDPAASATTMMAQLGGPRTWSRDRLRLLDLRDHLERDCVYLIGFAPDPSKVRLFRRQGGRSYTPVEPDAGASWTMYRIRIPVTLLAEQGT